MEGLFILEWINELLSIILLSLIYKGFNIFQIYQLKVLYFTFQYINCADHF